MNHRDSPCLKCGKETYHRTGLCMGCRNYGTASRPKSDSSPVHTGYSGRGRRNFGVVGAPALDLQSAITRLEKIVNDHRVNKKHAFCAADRVAIQRALEELKKENQVPT